jgi:hypothetical protein
MKLEKGDVYSKSEISPLVAFRAFPTEAILVIAGGMPGGGGGVVLPSNTCESRYIFR